MKGWNGRLCVWWKWKHQHNFNFWDHDCPFLLFYFIGDNFLKNSCIYLPYSALIMGEKSVMMLKERPQIDHLIKKKSNQTEVVDTTHTHTHSHHHNQTFILDLQFRHIAIYREMFVCWWGMQLNWSRSYNLNNGPFLLTFFCTRKEVIKSFISLSAVCRSSW